jgi:ferredoxin
MIVAEQKPIQEILSMLPASSKILVAGCGTCVTVCMAGGEKEVTLISSVLRMSDKQFKEVKGVTIERQCDKEFIREIEADVEKAEVVLSLACGAGVQMMSDYFSGKLILPGLNTLFMGSNEGAGYWLERCEGCGNCVLHITGGICPRVRCSKGLMNGPCGGSENGKCEVDPENLECGWNLIYKRLKELHRLDMMLEIQPPQNWSSSHHGGPRNVKREDVLL